MSNCIIYRNHEYLVVLNGRRNQVYYTVINTKLNTHVHINDSIKSCKIIVKKAINNDTSKCSMYMQHKIQILLGENKEWNDMHKTKVYSHNLY